MEERPMPPVAIIALVIALVCCAGVFSLACRRCHWPPHCVRWGQRVLVIGLGCLGLLGTLTALYTHRSLILVGLMMALFLVGLLWEGPRREPLPRSHSF